MNDEYYESYTTNPRDNIIQHIQLIQDRLWVANAYKEKQNQIPGWEDDLTYVLTNIYRDLNDVISCIEELKLKEEYDLSDD